MYAAAAIYSQLLAQAIFMPLSGFHKAHCRRTGRALSLWTVGRPQVSALRQKLAAAARSAAEAMGAQPAQALPPRDPPGDAAERPMDVDCQALEAEPGQRAPKQEAAGAERPLFNGALPTTEGLATRKRLTRGGEI